MSRPRRRVLAVASAGGHWMQLLMLRPSFAHHETTWLTTLRGLTPGSGDAPVRIVPDCNRDTPLRVLACLAAVTWHVLRCRPHVVITTGALPGVLALAAGRLLGARTIWVDSIANAEEMSASGRLAARFASHRLSQWPDVAEAEGATFAGSILNGSADPLQGPDHGPVRPDAGGLPEDLRPVPGTLARPNPPRAAGEPDAAGPQVPVPQDALPDPGSPR
ncbi:hypothetical protein [Jannaschia formosa]|uniref:hypothetical protein n=1 Tax=Jannaschia formosa TaxID=2259592 RepID=UPI001ADDCF0F|nr:hypothetical protein [Jannaschia formosa]